MSGFFISLLHFLNLFIVARLIKSWSLFNLAWLNLVLSNLTFHLHLNFFVCKNLILSIVIVFYFFFITIAVFFIIIFALVMSFWIIHNWDNLFILKYFILSFNINLISIFLIILLSLILDLLEYLHLYLTFWNYLVQHIIIILTILWSCLIVFGKERLFICRCLYLSLRSNCWRIYNYFFFRFNYLIF